MRVNGPAFLSVTQVTPDLKVVPMPEDTDAPPPVTADQAARRRRTALIVVVVAVVIAAVGVTLTVRSLNTASDDTATSSSAVAPSSAPDPSPGTPSATTSAAPTSAAVPTAIPSGFTLPNEGQAGWAAADGTLNFCTGVTVPLTGVADQRQIKSAANAESSRLEGIYVFASADAAVTFATEAEKLAAGCVSSPPAGESSAVTPLQGDWATAFAWYNAYADGAPGGNYVLLARKGSAVMVSGGYGEWPAAPANPDPGALAQYQPPLEKISAQACVFTEAGC